MDTQKGFVEPNVFINGLEYVPERLASPIGDLVIVRTCSAGVHIGEFDVDDWKKAGQVICLKNSRRIWRWRGASTLNEVAVTGVDRQKYTRISKPVSSIRLVPIELIPVVEGLDFREVWND